VTCKSVLVLGMSLLLMQGHAQYFQFSQYNFSSQRVNPAQIGLSHYAALSALFRNQKTGGDFNLNSNFVSGTYPLLNQSTGKPLAGIGISLMDDRTSGIFQSQEAAVNFALNVRLSRYRLLSFGVKGRYQTQRISYDGFYTGSQYITDRGFDHSLPSAEEDAALRNSFFSYSTGIYWQETDKRETVTAYWGASLFDFNRPGNSVLNNDSRLSPSFVFTGGVCAYKQKKLAIVPELLYTLHARNHSLNVGAKFQYELDATAKKVISRLDVITKYVLGRSGIIGFQFHRENFSAGVSYDFPLFKKNTGNLGAIEIGLELRKPVSTRAQKLQAKRKAEQQKKKPVTKSVIVKTTKKDSVAAKQEIAEAKETLPKAVEIVMMDSVNTKTQTKATAGNLSQEALLMEKITLHFRFEFNSVDLDDETENFLHDLSLTLKEDESLQVVVIGHTDNIGHEKFNQKLSLKRAEAIRTFLIHSGIKAERLKAEGKGLTSPLVPNDSDENRAKNRRVEIKVYHQ
jgi:type IX secretion system PorP/SprF family membrane protein